MIHVLAIVSRLPNGNILDIVSSNSDSTNSVEIYWICVSECKKLGKKEASKPLLGLAGL